ncbi:MAG: glycosyltransferase family 2 protein [Bacteroidales bacterium]|nr:glycosyltransferase family 2 protein [Bacteroidales bacterium]
MKLSIVIVNYNVKYFLEQCLYAVRKAINSIEAEVFVVDNNSVDGSVKMLNEKFPEVNIIINKDNKGFSKANNQAIKKAKGEYILLLNPDTVVEDDTFKKIISFMDKHPDAGGLGVKMLDGKGKFLPESKRGLPTPAVAFYKIFGLSKLFPKSKTFAKYHLGYLDNNKIHEVEILSGACMLLRKKVLDKIGLLDESFFMYGEDIDMSYRIIKAGYKNYYFPETRIIHYKGESTKKSSVNYVFIFYNAMIIFAKKHFSQKNAKIFSFLINIAVYLRAFIAIINRFFSKALLPVIDTAFLFTGIFIIKNYWEHNVIFPYGGHYPAELISIAIPVYILIWLFSVYLSGGYDHPIRLIKIFQGLLIGTVIILVFYSLLPESYRFSRAIILFGALWGFISMLGIRLIFHLLNLKNYRIGTEKNKRFIIVGEKEEAERVAQLLRKSYINTGFIGLISISDNKDKNEGFIGNLIQIKDIITIYKIDEVVFCAKDLPAQEIIDKMSELHYSQVEYKIAPPESLSIIGSNSINTSGDIYIIDINSIAKINNKRNKRFTDIIASTILLSILPVAIIFIKKPFKFIINIFYVFFAIKSWVGYYYINDDEIQKLPKIKKGILNPTNAFKNRTISNETINKLNLLYARDYKITNDLNIIFKGFKFLGNT